MSRARVPLWKQLREEVQQARNDGRVEGALWGALATLLVAGPLFWWLGSVFGR